eukprot:TRINITY_DN8942_c0_g1_i3.p1 TRINITY_DN8942_c0_g1~~TRINITY_DN8942_c0_g1_i3.p1  ORF type:complete len:461 (+),score=79.76 TRINITY_DN8942_c0_g1_i3:36-1418(+)
MATWTWQDDRGGYRPFAASDSAALELHRSRGLPGPLRLTIHGQQYDIDTKRMLQTNTATKKSRPIRREGDSGSSPATSSSTTAEVQSLAPVWEFQGDGAAWVAYGPTETAALESAFQGSGASVDITIRGTPYSVDLLAMQQTNAHTKRSRKIRRRMARRERAEEDRSAPQAKRPRHEASRTPQAEGGDGEQQQYKEGQQWVQPGEFAGKSILMVFYYTGEDVTTYVPPLLRKAGFTVKVLEKPKDLPDLRQFDQVWVVAGSTVDPGFKKGHVRAFTKFAQAGKGLYVLADNEPYCQEADIIGKALHAVDIKGNHPGGKMVKILPFGTLGKVCGGESHVPVDLNQRMRRSLVHKGQLYAEDHEIFTGFTSVFEGITVANIGESPDLEVVLRASDEQPLVSVSIRPGENVIYDGGWTRMCYRPDNTNGLDDTAKLWFTNVAAFLQGKRRLPQQQQQTDEGPS